MVNPPIEQPEGVAAPELETGPAIVRADYVAAREAAAMLDVKLATLYAYTSRGLIRSVPVGHGRARLYLRRDLERLCARRDARAGHGPVAAAALRFGEPVLDSSISAISATAGPQYRGHGAIDLARSRTPFESVAELLWSGSMPEADEAAVAADWHCDDLGLPIGALRDLLQPALPPVVALAVVVPLLGSLDPGRFAERRAAVLPRARTLIRRMAAALAIVREPDAVAPAIAASLAADSTAEAVAAALRGGKADAVPERAIVALNRALVIGADHELNASTFAARVAASTGADVYGCVAAALACLSGPRHGGASDRVEALVVETGEPEQAERVVHERQRRGEAIDGFRHPLYPDGDPRGEMLVALARELEPTSLAARTCLALIDAIGQEDGGGPTIDAGLVALALALELPRGAAIGLFAIARSAGWIAHVIEQYEAGYLVRPRARYLGRV